MLALLALAIAALAVLLQASDCEDGTSQPGWSYDEMVTYMRGVEPVVDSYFDQLGLTSPQIEYVSAGTIGQKACPDWQGNYTYGDQILEYCAVDQTIRLGQASLWVVRNYGHTAVLLTLAHEYGHHLQTLSGTPLPQTVQDVTVRESQADCIAGAWLGSTTIYDPDQVARELDAFLPWLAEAEGSIDPEVLRQRDAAIGMGFQSGIHGCNTFYPDIPIVQ